MTRYRQDARISLNGIFTILVGIAFLVALFFIARGVFLILEFLAPVLLIGALIINYKTVINFGRFLFRLLAERTLLGILAIILAIIGFPIVAGFLFGKSLLDRKVNSMLREADEENAYVEYEDITDTDPPLELRELPEERRRNTR